MYYDKDITEALQCIGQLEMLSTSLLIDAGWL